jgi:hypothetical protein
LSQNGREINEIRSQINKKHEIFDFLQGSYGVLTLEQSKVVQDLVKTDLVSGILKDFFDLFEQTCKDFTKAIL